MKWYKRDPDAAIAGMIGLTLEERAVYNTIIDLLYSRGGELPTDDHFFSRACECRPQTWRRIRDALIAKGKLHYKTDGKLTANRVVNELQTARKLMAKRPQTDSKPPVESSVSDEKQNNFNAGDIKPDRADPPVRAREQPQPQPQKREKAKKLSLSLPADWQPDRDHARKRGWTEERIDGEAQRFRDHASMNDRKTKDWNAAWRNWITSPYQQNGAHNGTGRQLQDDRLSVGKAAERLAELPGFELAPRPSLVSGTSQANRRLLPKG